jgi:RNA polymerase sigma factor (sigma-70 family)
MANAQNSVALSQIHRLFNGGVTGDLTDAELLRRFLAHEADSAECAFAALVDRHGPMVLRVACSFLRDSHDAEDAFQATFLVLARKAHSLHVGDSLGPWLHGVTCRVATRMRATKIRRQNHERRATERLPAALNDHAADDLGSTLDEEINRLPDRYRAAVVLCLVQGLTQEQAALRMGWPPGTVRSRLARGRQLLQHRLVHRGLAPSAVILGASPARIAVSGTTVDATTQLAIRSLSGSLSAMITSATVKEVTAQVLRSLAMNWVRMHWVKIVSVVGLVACLGAAGSYLATNRHPLPAPEPTKSDSNKAAAARWEYQSVRLVNEYELADRANAEASKGWELIEVVPVIQGLNGNIHTQYTMLFRRTPGVQN